MELDDRSSCRIEIDEDAWLCENADVEDEVVEVTKQTELGGDFNRILLAIRRTLC